nr:serine/threonine-protein kinase Aurora-1 [Ipomoea batatas]
MEIRSWSQLDTSSKGFFKYEGTKGKKEQIILWHKSSGSRAAETSQMVESVEHDAKCKTIWSHLVSFAIEFLLWGASVLKAKEHSGTIQKDIVQVDLNFPPNTPLSISC